MINLHTFHKSNMQICLSTSVPVYMLPASSILPVYLSTCLLIYSILPVYLSTCLLVYLFTYLPVYILTYLDVSSWRWKRFFLEMIQVPLGDETDSSWRWHRFLLEDETGSSWRWHRFHLEMKKVPMTQVPLGDVSGSSWRWQRLFYYLAQDLLRRFLSTSKHV